MSKTTFWFTQIDDDGETEKTVLELSVTPASSGLPIYNQIQRMKFDETVEGIYQPKAGDVILQLVQGDDSVGDPMVFKPSTAIWLVGEFLHRPDYAAKFKEYA